jgi:selenocysteine lyase/cysteine desulfurase
LFVVDAFHALGVFPFDAKKDGVDVLVSGFYKWMCGPHGVACVYTNENVLQDLKPTYMGWHGVEDNVIERIQQNRDAFDVPFPHDRAGFAATAARFEWGTWATVAVIGALESMKFALESNADSRFQAIRKRRDELVEGLRKLGLKFLTPKVDAKHLGSGIVTFEAKNHRELVRKLASSRIMVSGRFGYIRVSPHFYNTQDDIDKLLEALKDSL